MSKKYRSNFQKKNILPQDTLSLKSPTDKDSLFFGGCIAISSDSQQIVTFSQETHEFKLYNIDDLSSSKQIFTLECEANNKRLWWSLAISNRIGDDGNERLIALSCFDARKFRPGEMNGDEENVLDFDGNKVNNQYGDDENNLESDNNRYDDDESDLESCKNENDIESAVNNQYCDDKSNLKYSDNCQQPQTWIVSTKDGSEIYTSLESIGGIIRFLDRDDNDDNQESNSDDSDDSDESDNYDSVDSYQSLKLKNEKVIIIVNASGIFKETIKKKKRKRRFFSRSSQIKKFELPQQLSVRLSRDHWYNSLELLNTNIIKNHFMVHSFENRQQIIEMYNLITGDLEMLFKRHESSVAPNIIHGSPIFAISQNEKILAFCRGTTSITLYSMENGLEITTKQLESQRGIYKIVSINFIDHDIKILIVLEKEDRQGENSKHQIFVVWDLFTTFENSIRQIDYSETLKPLKMDHAHRLMNSHGNVFAVRDSGDIFSILDHKDVALIRNPLAKAIIEIDISTRNNVYHAIYNMDGEIIINNVEPWYQSKNYFRISVYLDSTKSTQLIISSNTIQVWKYRNNNNAIEKQDKRSDRVLEYIWARNEMIDVRELRIGEREFVLKVLVPSTKCPTSKSITIHWPNNVNVLEGACRTLYVLGEKNHIVAGHENINQMKYLVECTQRLVRKYITKYGIFRLTSIRYPIMKYLIKSYQENLIKRILNKKINKKNSNIYVPSLYKWTGEDKLIAEILNSDLHHAILCIQKRGDSTVILKYLIDYYTDNAKEYNNHGWMFTVSKAIPLLYDYHLSEFVQYLFKKPCFGITEAYTPPLHINLYDRKKGNDAAVMHSLVDAKPRLVSKFHNTLSFSLKNLFTRFQTSHNDRKVYIVPLPDFTVCPNSPKVLEDHSENYSKYFWFLFTLIRISLWPRRKIINDTRKMSPFLRVIHEEKGNEIYQAPTIMATIDFKWSAARRYFIRHIILYILYIISFGSLLFPLANIASVLYNYQVFVSQNSVHNSALAFTALVMWFQLLFLSRYFEGPGRFIHIIKSILNTIRPFLAVMFIVVPRYDFDKSSRFDNYYSNFISSVEYVFFWTNGRWDQLSQWDSYTVDVMSILGSIILVLIFQNLLIAFMNAAFDKANKAGHAIAYKHHAELIAEYEALEKPFGSKRGNPRYIYYIPDPDIIDTWLKETKKDEKQKLRLTGVDLDKLTDFDYSDDDDDCDDDDNDDDDDNQGTSLNMDLDSIEPSTTKYNGTINKISFIDEEIFSLKVVTSKLITKSQRKWKSNNKLLKNLSHNSYNKSSNELLSKNPGPKNADDQLSIQERFNNLETRFDELEQNLKTILKTLNNLKK
ncbi:hypothetical protein Glove_19g308 [Diversispora epigaea]|uniref:Ion transport domain-containing protein n=1 Tax=Diversispora epigaea TaxID=1348612 RepID=A0A397JWY2_9GLOM|nr:hypothetical protein Glove_19g308 [Diversispora epigaea]